MFLLYTGDTTSLPTPIPIPTPMPTAFLRLLASSIQETPTPTAFLSTYAYAYVYAPSSSMYRRSIPCSLVGWTLLPLCIYRRVVPSSLVWLLRLCFLSFLYIEIDTLFPLYSGDMYSIHCASFPSCIEEWYSYVLHSLLLLLPSCIYRYLYTYIPIYHAAMLLHSPYFHLPFAYSITFL